MTYAEAEGSALIVGEAHHRFANSLQVIVSATNVILRSGGCDPQACARIQALQQQVTALAEVNRSLCGPYNAASLSRDALHHLCAGLAASFERPDTRLCIAVSGHAGGSDTCRTLLLLVSELMMNAMKHGSRDRRPTIRISLTITPDKCVLQVGSNTAGQSVTANRPRIAGELVRAADGTLQVEIDGEEYGVTAVLPTSEFGRTP